jgi:hypothetical protein
MKIKDAVVIDSKILMESVKYLGILGMTDLSNELLFQHRKLEPIISKSWDFESQKMELEDYLNDTEI